jgi:hypothetical protein
MACKGTSLPLPLLSDNLNDVSPIAVTSQGQWLESAQCCHNIKAPTNSFWQPETGEILATYAKNSSHILKIFLQLLIQETHECNPL